MYNQIKQSVWCLQKYIALKEKKKEKKDERYPGCGQEEIYRNSVNKKKKKWARDTTGLIQYDNVPQKQYAENQNWKQKFNLRNPWFFNLKKSGDVKSYIHVIHGDDIPCLQKIKENNKCIHVVRSTVIIIISYRNS